MPATLLDEAKRAAPMTLLSESESTLPGLRLHCADGSAPMALDLGIVHADLRLFFVRMGDGRLLTGVLDTSPCLSDAEGEDVRLCPKSMLVLALNAMVSDDAARNRSGLPLLGFFKNFQDLTSPGQQKKVEFTLIVRSPLHDAQKEELFLEADLEAFELPTTPPPPPPSPDDRKRTRSA